MNGPQHYRKAEIHAQAARNEENPEWALVQAQLATAHATLAVAAATACIDETPRSDSFANYRAWQDVAGAEAPS